MVYIVLHAKVGCHPVDQHSVVGRHVRELLEGAESDRNGGKMQRRERERGQTNEVERVKVERSEAERETEGVRERVGGR